MTLILLIFNKICFLSCTKKSAFNLYASKVNGKYKQEIWILGVKKQTNSSLVEI